MKLFTTDIEKIDWLWKLLPQDFREIKQYEYFVFYYNNIEEQSEIDIKYFHKLKDFDTDKTLQIQAQQGTQQYGFLTTPVDTDNVVVYMFFKYWISKNVADETQKAEYYKKLDILFLDYKAEDIKAAREESLSKKSGVYPTNSTSEMETAIQKFVRQPKMRNGVLKAFEIVNSYFKNKYGHQLYGKKLKKVIRLINNPSGGIITEAKGSVRYMLVGEKSLKANTDGSLDKAKEMLRARIDPLIIRQDTGWTMNPFDGKWRKRISDKEMKLQMDKYVTFDNDLFPKTQIYAPFSQGISQMDIYAAIKDATRTGAKITELLQEGYKGVIGDVVYHPLLFEYYPELREMPYFSAFYLSGNHGYNYYFSETPRHIMMYGMMGGSDKYILLHEMQHYIQSVEGFGNGGNTNLSEMVLAAGGSDVRKFLTMYHEGTKKFCSEAQNLELDKVADYFKSVNLRGGWALMQEIFKNPHTIKKDCERAFMGFAKYYSKFAPTAPALRQIARDVFGEWYMEFFELVAKGEQEVDVLRQNFANKGWSADEVRALLFNTYQMLSGELESREVQHTAEISEELLDYFKYYSSETRRHKDITVVFKEGIIEEVADYQGALETTDDGDYIIHVKQSKFGDNMLHELGHIIEDEAMNEAYFEIITKAYTRIGQEKFESVSEFFVECYLGWIVRREIDEHLSAKLKPKLIFPSLVETDVVFNYMFGYESERMDLQNLDKCYEFVNNLLKIV